MQLCCSCSGVGRSPTVHDVSECGLVDMPGSWFASHEGVVRHQVHLLQGTDHQHWGVEKLWGVGRSQWRDDAGFVLQDCGDGTDEALA
jgi:hypothetical protein